MRDLKYLLAYSLPLSAYLAVQWGGWWSWSTVFLAFGVFPLLDIILPVSVTNYSEEEEKSRLGNRFFDFLLYVCPFICFALLYLFFQQLRYGDLEVLERAGLTGSMGVVLGALGINVSHELGHRTSRWERFLAKAGLLPVLYQHFYIEHNRGHHKAVGTDEDPASARKNEWLYSFFIRSITGQYRNAWRLEKNRLAKIGVSSFSWDNLMIRFTVYQFSYLLFVAGIFGWEMLPYALAVAFIGILLLETINYIEHYGLRRAIGPNGRPERVLPKHSWNSDHEMGRIVLFELTRHSDHHYLATRKYQILRHMDESPQLPTGYPGSMLLALVPPLWFRLMNKRLEADRG